MFDDNPDTVINERIVKLVCLGVILVSSLIGSLLTSPNYYSGNEYYNSLERVPEPVEHYQQAVDESNKQTELQNTVEKLPPETSNVNIGGVQVIGDDNSVSVKDTAFCVMGNYCAIKGRSDNGRGIPSVFGVFALAVFFCFLPLTITDITGAYHINMERRIQITFFAAAMFYMFIIVGYIR